MSFLTNLFVSLKGTGSMNTNASLHSDGDSTSNRIDEEWEFITAHEAGVIYHGRITILLSPNRETRHCILIADMPKSSELLNYVRTLDPSHRNAHLFFPDLQIAKSYLKSPTISVDSLAIEESWLDIIKLAITADVFQDPYVEGTALAALEQKGIIALTPGNTVLIFDQHDFAFAQEYQTKTGNGKKLIQTLCEIAKMGMEKSVTPKVQFPKAQAVKPRSQGFKQRTAGTKYGNSMLKGLGSGAVKKGSDGDDKIHPTRQPSIPLNVEALKRGDVSNFVWPDVKCARW